MSESRCIWNDIWDKNFIDLTSIYVEDTTKLFDIDYYKLTLNL